VIVVSVTGAVKRPGLVRLSVGARVAEAISKAGGVTARANLTGLNLAEKLSDGASVVVVDTAASASGSLSSVSGPGSGTGPGAPSTGAPAGKVDLNTADVSALDALPGVGPVTAAAIVGWRNKNGRFTSVEQLQEIQGIGPAKYASLSPLVKV
jgi:competence protein ComEA